MNNNNEELNQIKIERRIHPHFDHMEKVRRAFKHEFSQIVGKYQYIVSSKKGKISIVELPNYFADGVTLWEIMALEGNIFDDIERFPSYYKAVKQAEKYLK